jgi:hypothetical protein
MAGALALGTVVSVGAIAPANAADATYNCPTSTGQVLTVPVSMANPFTGSYAAGDSVPAENVLMNATLNSTLIGVIGLLLPPGTTSIAGTIEDATMKVGSQKVPLTGMAAPSTPINPAGMTLPVAGKTSPFTAVGGDQKVFAPESFTFVPAGLPALALPCTIANPTQVGTMKVSGSSAKAASKTTATLKNAPITKGEHAKILAKVRSAGAAAAGKVIAKEGSKVLKKATLNSKGKATLKLPVLSKGMHKIVIKYKGNATTQASKDVVKFSAKG